jgi:hypothetical protein
VNLGVEAKFGCGAATMRPRFIAQAQGFHRSRGPKKRMKTKNKTFGFSPGSFGGKRKMRQSVNKRLTALQV